MYSYAFILTKTFVDHVLEEFAKLQVLYIH